MLVAALVALVPLLFLIFQIKKTIFPGSEKVKLPPGPNTWQILGKAFQLRKDPRTALRDLAKIYGPLMSLRLASQVVIIASSAATAREVLQTQDRNFSGRFIPWALYKVPQLTKASIAMNKECHNEWKFFRGISQNHIFSSKSIEAKAKADTRKAKAVEMVKYLQGKQGRVVQLDDLIVSTIHNIISNMLVSKNIYNILRDDDEKMRVAIHDVIQIAASSIGFSDLFPLLRKIDFWSKRKVSGIYTSTVYMWADVVKERRSIRSEQSLGYDNNNIDGDFLDVLLDNALSDDQIYVVLTEILIGSTHTSAVVSTWLMAELIKNPQILSRVREEVAEAFDDDKMMINESILTESQYLQACIKETLRFHNPGPLIMPHQALERCKIDNYMIPKDSIVVVNVEAIGLDPESWKDADVFNPDRFFGSNIDYRGTHFEFIPFSAGRRMCPGFNVAFKNIQIVVASLVHCFDWSLPNGMDLDTIDMSQIYISGVLEKEKPLHLIPKSIVRLI